jgi:hypothetical protein
LTLDYLVALTVSADFEETGQVLAWVLALEEELQILRVCVVVWNFLHGLGAPDGVLYRGSIKLEEVEGDVGLAENSECVLAGGSCIRVPDVENDLVQFLLTCGRFLVNPDDFFCQWPFGSSPA